MERDFTSKSFKEHVMKLIIHKEKEQLTTQQKDLPIYEIDSAFLYLFEKNNISFIAVTLCDVTFISILFTSELSPSNLRYS